MLSRVARQDVGGDLEVRYWRDGGQLEEQLAAAMRKHLKLTDDKKAYILPIPTKPPGCNGIMPSGIPE
jgi:hypothetical protein